MTRIIISLMTALALLVLMAYRSHNPPDHYINNDFFIRAFFINETHYALYHTDIKNNDQDDDLVITGIFGNRIYNIAWNKEYIYCQTYHDKEKGTLTRVSTGKARLIEYGLPYALLKDNNLVLKPLAEAYKEL